MNTIKSLLKLHLHGNTIIFVSIEGKNLNTFSYLMQQYGDKIFQEKNNNGDNILHMAARVRSKEIFFTIYDQDQTLLMEKNLNGVTPFDILLFHKKVKTLRSICQKASFQPTIFKNQEMILDKVLQGPQNDQKEVLKNAGYEHYPALKYCHNNMLRALTALYKAGFCLKRSANKKNKGPLSHALSRRLQP